MATTLRNRFSRLRWLLVGALLCGGVGLVAWGVLDGPGKSARATGTPDRASTATTTPDAPSVAPSQVLEAPPQPDPAIGEPRRLLIPDLGVDARVEPIPATDGVLVPPTNPQVLGWWQDGAEPGAALGGALITGHTVHTGGGALDDLERLGEGDPLTVRTATGQVDYVVDEVTIYRKARLAQVSAEVFNQGVPGRLVVITCEDWDGTKYLSNVVVLARMMRLTDGG